MNKLKFLMTKKKITKQGLAKVSGVSFWSIDNYVKGKRPLDKAPIETLIRLALILDCKISDLLENTNRLDTDKKNIIEIKELLTDKNIERLF